MLRVILQGCDYCESVSRNVVTVWDDDYDKQMTCCNDCFCEYEESRYV